MAVSKVVPGITVDPSVRPAAHTSDTAAGDPSTADERATRQLIRTTAGKLLRSEELIGEEQPAAIAFLRDNLHIGNPHIVRCGYCQTSRMLFRDENEAPFILTSHGWRCEPCDVNAATQEIAF